MEISINEDTNRFNANKKCKIVKRRQFLTRESHVQSFFYFEIKCKIKWTKLSFTKSINSYQNLHETQWNRQKQMLNVSKLLFF